MLLVVHETDSAAWHRALIDVRWDLVFMEYGGPANDALGTHLRILYPDVHSLVHSKIFDRSLDGQYKHRSRRGGRSESGIRYQHNARAATQHHLLGRLRDYLSYRRQGAP
jgi:hypothetical protein